MPVFLVFLIFHVVSFPSPGEEVQMTVERSGQDQILSLTPELDEESNVYLIAL